MPAAVVRKSAALASARTAQARRDAAATVGVRELRQNLSIYLDQVKQGATLHVTEHGRVVATLQPAAAEASRLDRLVALGLATPARSTLRALPAPKRLRTGAPATSAVLDELSSDRT